MSLTPQESTKLGMARYGYWRHRGRVGRERRCGAGPTDLSGREDGAARWLATVFSAGKPARARRAPLFSDHARAHGRFLRRQTYDWGEPGRKLRRVEQVAAGRLRRTVRFAAVVERWRLPCSANSSCAWPFLRRRWVIASNKLK